MDSLYEGSFSAPDPVSAKPRPGAKVTLVVSGLGFSAGESAAKGVQEAGQAAGWDITVVDGKFDLNAQLAGIRQAVAHKADGILLYLIDCPGVKSGLEEAKAANIPVVGIESFDCRDVDKGGPQLISPAGLYNSAPYGGQVTYADGWITAWGRSSADTMINALNGKANVIDAIETDSQGTLHIEEGYRQAMADCPGCKTVAEVKFTAADLGPVLQQKIAQAIVQHPEANAIYGGYDAPITGGIAAAVRSSGRKLYVTGGEGHPENLALVRKANGQNAGTVSIIEWEAWGGVDALNRIFDGKEPGATGIGIQVYDKDHNLPAEGETFEAGIDFRAEYKKAWGVG